jgi:hypothetical protein
MVRAQNGAEDVRHIRCVRGKLAKQITSKARPLASVRQLVGEDFYPLHLRHLDEQIRQRRRPRRPSPAHRVKPLLRRTRGRMKRRAGGSARASMFGVECRLVRRGSHRPLNAALSGPASLDSDGPPEYGRSNRLQANVHPDAGLKRPSSHVAGRLADPGDASG